jgi:hypothetical protein
MGARVEAYGLDQIMGMYDLFDRPYYSVWRGKQLMFTNEDDNEVTAAARLRQAISAWQPNCGPEIYTIRFYNDSKDISSAKAYSGSFNCILTDYNAEREAGRLPAIGSTRDNITIVPPQQQTDPALLQLLERLADNQQQLSVRLTALEAPEYEEDDEEEEETEAQRLERVTNNIGSIVQTAAPLIKDIMGLFSGFRFGGSQPAQVAAIGNVVDPPEVLQEKVNTALTQLESKLGAQTTADALLSISNMPADRLQWLLKML